MSSAQLKAGREQQQLYRHLGRHFLVYQQMLQACCQKLPSKLTKITNMLAKKTINIEPLIRLRAPGESADGAVRPHVAWAACGVDVTAKHGEIHMVHQQLVITMLMVKSSCGPTPFSNRWKKECQVNHCFQRAT